MDMFSANPLRYEEQCYNKLIKRLSLIAHFVPMPKSLKENMAANIFYKNPVIFYEVLYYLLTAYDKREICARINAWPLDNLEDEAIFRQQTVAYINLLKERHPGFDVLALTSSEIKHPIGLKYVRYALQVADLVVQNALKINEPDEDYQANQYKKILYLTDQLELLFTDIFLEVKVVKVIHKDFKVYCTDYEIAELLSKIRLIKLNLYYYVTKVLTYYPTLNYLRVKIEDALFINNLSNICKTYFLKLLSQDSVTKKEILILKNYAASVHEVAKEWIKWIQNKVTEVPFFESHYFISKEVQIYIIDKKCKVKEVSEENVLICAFCGVEIDDVSKCVFPTTSDESNEFNEKVVINSHSRIEKDETKYNDSNNVDEHGNETEIEGGMLDENSDVESITSDCDTHCMETLNELNKKCKLFDTLRETYEMLKKCSKREETDNDEDYGNNQFLNNVNVKDIMRKMNNLQQIKIMINNFFKNFEKEAEEREAPATMNNNEGETSEIAQYNDNVNTTEHCVDDTENYVNDSESPDISDESYDSYYTESYVNGAERHVNNSGSYVNDADWYVHNSGSYVNVTESYVNNSGSYVNYADSYVNNSESYDNDAESYVNSTAIWQERSVYSAESYVNGAESNFNEALCNENIAGRYDTAGSDVNSADSNVYSADSNVKSANSNVNSAHSNVNGANSNVNSADSNVNNADSNVNSADSDVSSADSNINGADSNVNSAHSNVNGANSNVNSADSNVNSADSNVNSTDSSVNSADSSVNSADINVNSADSNVNSADSNVNSADSNVNSADSNINSADSNVNSADSNVNSAHSSVNSADNNINSADSNINSADSNINSADSNINSADGNINSADGYITSAESNVSSAKNSVNSEESNINNAEHSVNDDESNLKIVRINRIITVESHLKRIVRKKRNVNGEESTESYVNTTISNINCTETNVTNEETLINDAVNKKIQDEPLDLSKYDYANTFIKIVESVGDVLTNMIDDDATINNVPKDVWIKQRQDNILNEMKQYFDDPCESVTGETDEYNETPDECVSELTKELNKIIYTDLPNFVNTLNSSKVIKKDSNYCISNKLAKIDEVNTVNPGYDEDTDTGDEDETVENNGSKPGSIENQEKEFKSPKAADEHMKDSSNIINKQKNNGTKHKVNNTNNVNKTIGGSKTATYKSSTTEKGSYSKYKKRNRYNCRSPEPAPASSQIPVPQATVWKSIKDAKRPIKNYRPKVEKPAKENTEVEKYIQAALKKNSAAQKVVNDDKMNGNKTRVGSNKSVKGSNETLTVKKTKKGKNNETLTCNIAQASMNNTQTADNVDIASNKTDLIQHRSKDACDIGEAVINEKVYETLEKQEGLFELWSKLQEADNFKKTAENMVEMVEKTVNKGSNDINAAVKRLKSAENWLNTDDEKNSKNDEMTIPNFDEIGWNLIYPNRNNSNFRRIRYSVDGAKFHYLVYAEIATEHNETTGYMCELNVYIFLSVFEQNKKEPNADKMSEVFTISFRVSEEIKNIIDENTELLKYARRNAPEESAALSEGLRKIRVVQRNINDTIKLLRMKNRGPTMLQVDELMSTVVNERSRISDIKRDFNMSERRIRKIVLKKSELTVKNVEREQRKLVQTSPVPGLTPINIITHVKKENILVTGKKYKQKTPLDNEAVTTNLVDITNNNEDTKKGAVKRVKSASKVKSKEKPTKTKEEPTCCCSGFDVRETRRVIKDTVRQAHEQSGTASKKCKEILNLCETILCRHLLEIPHIPDIKELTKNTKQLHNMAHLLVDEFRVFREGHGNVNNGKKAKRHQKDLYKISWNNFPKLLSLSMEAEHKSQRNVEVPASFEYHEEVEVTEPATVLPPDILDEELAVVLLPQPLAPTHHADGRILFNYNNVIRCFNETQDTIRNVNFTYSDCITTIRLAKETFALEHSFPMLVKLVNYVLQHLEARENNADCIKNPKSSIIPAKRVSNKVRQANNEVQLNNNESRKFFNEDQFVNNDAQFNFNEAQCVHNVERFDYNEDKFVYNEDQFIYNKDQFVCNKDQFVYNKDQFIYNKEQFVCSKDQFVFNEDQFVFNEDQFVYNEDQFVYNDDQFDCNEDQFVHNDDQFNYNEDQFDRNDDQFDYNENQFDRNGVHFDYNKDQYVDNEVQFDCNEAQFVFNEAQFVDNEAQQGKNEAPAPQGNDRTQDGDNSAELVNNEAQQGNNEAQQSNIEAQQGNVEAQQRNNEARQGNNEAQQHKNEAQQHKNEAQRHKNEEQQDNEEIQTDNEAQPINNGAQQGNNEVPQTKVNNSNQINNINEDEGNQINNEVHGIIVNAKQVNIKVQEINNDAQEMNNETQEIINEALEINEAQEINNEAQEVNNKAQEIDNEAHVINNEALEIHNEAQEINNAAQEINNAAQKINNAAQEIINEAQEINNAAQEINNEALAINNEALEINEAQEINNKAQEINNEAQEINNEAQEINNAAQEINNAAQEINNEALAINNEALEINEAQEINNKAQEINNEAQEINNAAQEIINEAQEINNAAQEINNEALAINNEALEINEAQEINNKAQEINNEAQEINNAAQEINNEAQEINNAAQEISNEALAINNEALEINEAQEINNAAQEIINEAQEINNAAQEINNEALAINNEALEINEAQEINNKAQEINNEAQEINNEAQEINNSAQDIYNETQDIINEALEINSEAQEIYNGAPKINNNDQQDNNKDFKGHNAESNDNKDFGKEKDAGKDRNKQFKDDGTDLKNVNEDFKVNNAEYLNKPCIKSLEYDLDLLYNTVIDCVIINTVKTFVNDHVRKEVDIMIKSINVMIEYETKRFLVRGNCRKQDAVLRIKNKLLELCNDVINKLSGHMDNTSIKAIARKTAKEKFEEILKVEKGKFTNENKEFYIDVNEMLDLQCGINEARGENMACCFGITADEGDNASSDVIDCKNEAFCKGFFHTPNLDLTDLNDKYDLNYINEMFDDVNYYCKITNNKEMQQEQIIVNEGKIIDDDVNRTEKSISHNSYKHNNKKGKKGNKRGRKKRRNKSSNNSVSTKAQAANTEDVKKNIPATCVNSDAGSFYADDKTALDKYIIHAINNYVDDSYNDRYYTVTLGNFIKTNREGPEDIDEGIYKCICDWLENQPQLTLKHIILSVISAYRAKYVFIDPTKLRKIIKQVHDFVLANPLNKPISIGKLVDSLNDLTLQYVSPERRPDKNDLFENMEQDAAEIAAIAMRELLKMLDVNEDYENVCVKDSVVQQHVLGDILLKGISKSHNECYEPGCASCDNATGRLRLRAMVNVVKMEKKMSLRLKEKAGKVFDF